MFLPPFSVISSLFDGSYGFRRTPKAHGIEGLLESWHCQIESFWENMEGGEHHGQVEVKTRKLRNLDLEGAEKRDLDLWHRENWTVGTVGWRRRNAPRIPQPTESDCH